MSRKRDKPVAAEELLKELHSDPEWVARQEAREAKREALARAIYASEAPLVADLRRAGFDVESASDLFNRKEPWRKDVPISPWREAVPILVEHLARPYVFEVREGIVRALTVKFAYPAFDRLVEEFRRTAGPEVAAEEQRRAVELVMTGAGDVYTPDEVEQIMRHRWESFRFALGNAIGYLVQKEDLPVVVELLRDKRQPLEDRKSLAEVLEKKMRRWRRKDPEIVALVESLTSP